MRTNLRVVVSLLATVLLLATAGACGGDDDGDGGGSITIWTIEDLADRVQAQKQILADFTAKTNVQTKLVAVGEDKFDQLLTNAAAAGDLPDVVAALPLAAVRTMQANELLNTDLPGEIVDNLGRETFTPAALELDSDGDTVLGVPSDAWSQLLFYRKDLFDAAGLPEPNSYENIKRAAAALNKGGMVGFVAGTDPGSVFTQQSFEHLALANECELVDDSGNVTLDSPNCVESFGTYADLIQDYSVAGNQTDDSTRATYFAGKAAMLLWSSFLLDEMAGLRKDALPTCPECRADPAFLAKNSGVVAGLTGPSSGGKFASYGEVVSWVVTKDAATDPSRRLIEYMMSDGYEKWLAIAPEGKVPTRAGTKDEPQRYAQAWQGLKAGVDTKKPLADIYDKDVLDKVAGSPANFDRWGLPQGQGDLVGAILGQLPVPKALNQLIVSGGDSAKAAQNADKAVETIKKELG
jgi:multiple sugar transport system substrate-binding protein